MLLCDQIITDKESGKKTLVGIFDRVFYEGKSFVMPVSVFARLTDAAGAYHFAVEYAHVTTNRILGRAEIPDPVQIPDRLKFHELLMRAPAVIDALGVFEFRLYANGVYLGRVPFEAVPRSNAEGSSDDPNT
jgi:hypothetical protein